MNNSVLINQTSGNCEYYTPVEIVDAARKAMGGIDLDPASSIAANAYVRAKNIYTISDNGLVMPWKGRVWMNHPFSRDGNKAWIEKLLTSWSSGDVPQACCITYAATSERWFRDLMDFPQCFLSPRTNYLLPDGTVKRGVTKGSVVTYLGDNQVKFCREFDGKFGTVKF